MDRIIRTVDDRLADDQTNSATKTTKIDQILEITKTKMDLAKYWKFFTFYRGMDASFYKVNRSVDLNNFNLRLRHLEEQTVMQPLVPLLMDKNFRK